MAKNDIIPSLESLIDNEDVSYKSPADEALIKSMAENLNNLCDCISSIKCVVLPFGTTSWNVPTGFVAGVAVGFAGAGGGGGTAPAETGGGINNATIYQGSTGSAGGDTTINGLMIARRAAGGTRFRYVTVNDGGSATNDADIIPINPRYSTVRDSIKGLRAPIGGTGAHFNQDQFVLKGRSFALGGALGGEGSGLGATVISSLTPGSTVPVTIGAGGAGGANDPFSVTWAANKGYTLINATAGQNSPGIVIFYMEKP